MVNLRLPISSLAPARPLGTRGHNNEQYCDDDCGGDDRSHDNCDDDDVSLQGGDKWVFAEQQGGGCLMMFPFSARPSLKQAPEKGLPSFSLGPKPYKSRLSPIHPQRNF